MLLRVIFTSDANGEERPTTRVSGTQLSAEIDAADIAAPRTVGVSVINPEPTDSIPDALPFTIDLDAPPPLRFVYLPAVIR